MVVRRIVMGTLVLLVCLGLSGRLYASEKGHSEESGQAKEKESEKKIPDTLGGIWHEVNEGKEELDKIIDDKKLDEVHKTAFKIRDLVNLMPEKSRDLPEDKQKSLKESIKRVGEIAGLLDKYGDAGDEANTREQVRRLEKLLKYIESLYPEGALKSPDEKEDHHEDKEDSSHKEGHH